MTQKEDREGVIENASMNIPNVDVIHKHGTVIYLRRGNLSSMWKMLPKRTLKAVQDVWSQRELSVRLPLGWGKGQAEAEREGEDE